MNTTSDALLPSWSSDTRLADLLRGRRGLIVGVANEHSIATGCAAQLRASGAELALTYLNDKARPHVAPIAEALGAELLLPLDVSQPGQLEAVFDTLRERWGTLDFVLHSIAYAPKADLHGRITDCSQAGFLQAMQVSVHSFIEMARLAEPLLRPGGSLITMSYYGADKVVEHYNLMGPVKAALESTVRYLSLELAARQLRVYAVSPGPLMTRAASGIAHFDELVEMARQRSPEHRLVDIDEIGRVVSFLVSGAASGITGDVIYVDAGLHHMA